MPIGRITDPAVRALVATGPGGELAAFAFAAVEPARLLALYVHPDAAGRGVGRALLQRVEALLREEGATTVALAASRNAVSFYETCGYTRGEDLTQALADGTVMDAVHMQRTL